MSYRKNPKLFIEEFKGELINRTNHIQDYNYHYDRYYYHYSHFYQYIKITIIIIIAMLQYLLR